jgi:2-polyprenyl-3-methyl-5-hydroxy-6-metoxy-1,4-benzoquinol methylase
MCRTPAAAFFGRKNGYALSRCGSCGFVFLDPMPTRDELANLYRDEAGITADFYPKADSRFRRAFIKAIKFAGYIRGRDVIDVGCGGGFVAEAMRRVGGRATGLDISGRAIAYARRRFPSCEFACGVLEEFQETGRSFDFVYCSEVIEHVADADAFAAALARICRPGGRLFVTTPDIGHWRVPKDLVSWSLVDPPRHVRYFNAKSLTSLLERHGFTVRRKMFKLKPGLQVLAERV